MKRAALVRRVHVERPGPDGRLVGDETHHDAFDPAEADDDVFREGAMDLKEFVRVHNVRDDAAHVHRGLGIVGNEAADGVVRGERNVRARPMRRVLGIVLRQEGQQLAHDADGFGVILREEMHVAGHGGVHVGAADLLHGDRLARHRLDHLGTGDEHVGVLPGHDDEVHQRRRIGGAARAGAADHRDLRDHAGQQHVLEEHAAVAGERVDALLDARAGGILECDDGRAEFRRLLHQRHDFLRVHLAERAAEHGEILGEGRNHASIDIAGADNHAVGGQVPFSPCRNGAPDDAHGRPFPGMWLRRTARRAGRARSSAPWRGAGRAFRRLRHRGSPPGRRRRSSSRSENWVIRSPCMRWPSTIIKRTANCD